MYGENDAILNSARLFRKTSRCRFHSWHHATISADAAEAAVGIGASKVEHSAKMNLTALRFSYEDSVRKIEQEVITNTDRKMLKGHSALRKYEPSWRELESGTAFVSRTPAYNSFLKET